MYSTCARADKTTSVGVGGGIKNNYNLKIATLII